MRAKVEDSQQYSSQIPQRAVPTAGADIASLNLLSLPNNTAPANGIPTQVVHGPEDDEQSPVTDLHQRQPNKGRVQALVTNSASADNSVDTDKQTCVAKRRTGKRAPAARPHQATQNELELELGQLQRRVEALTQCNNFLEAKAAAVNFFLESHEHEAEIWEDILLLNAELFGHGPTPVLDNAFQLGPLLGKLPGHVSTSKHLFLCPQRAAVPCLEYLEVILRAASSGNVSCADPDRRGPLQGWFTWATAFCAYTQQASSAVAAAQRSSSWPADQDHCMAPCLLLMQLLNVVIVHPVMAQTLAKTNFETGLPGVPPPGHWTRVMENLQLNGLQQLRIVALWEVFTKHMQQALAEQQQIMEQIAQRSSQSLPLNTEHSLPAEVVDGSLASALKACLMRQHRTVITFGHTYLFRILSPLQTLRLLLLSWPFFPDGLSICQEVVAASGYTAEVAAQLEVYDVLAEYSPSM